MNEQIKIPLHKKKMVPYFLGAGIFVLLGIWIFLAAFQHELQLVGRIVFFLTGFASILFFGLVVIVLLLKLITKNAGLIISDDGLTDNSSGLSAGFIDWSDIRSIHFSGSGINKFLIIKVKKPEKYINRESNVLKRTAMHLNHKMSGSPIHILVSFLEINEFMLQDMIATKRFKKKQIL